VYTGFGFEVSESIVAGNVECNVFNSRFFARLIVENLFAKTAPVAPAQIHAQKNLRPILRLGAAGAGVKRNNGVAPVIGLAEQLRQLGLRHLLGNYVDLAGSFAERLVALLVFSDVEKKSRLRKIGLMFFPTSENAFEGRLFFENALRLVGVVPKIRLGSNLVQFRDALLLGVDVKAASAVARAALRGG
jgi:hypothetical protein